jgi:hypothetical protein
MKRMVPSEAKAQAVKDLLAGLDGERTGSELLSELVRRSTEQV